MTDCSDSCVRKTMRLLSSFFSILMSAGSQRETALLVFVSCLTASSSSWRRLMELSGKRCHCNIMYLADFFEKMNEVTLELQGNNITLVKSKAVIRSLTFRLDLYRQSIGWRQFAHFPQLAKVIFFHKHH